MNGMRQNWVNRVALRTMEESTDADQAIGMNAAMAVVDKWPAAVHPCTRHAT